VAPESLGAVGRTYRVGLFLSKIMGDYPVFSRENGHKRQTLKGGFFWALARITASSESGCSFLILNHSITEANMDSGHAREPSSMADLFCLIDPYREKIINHPVLNFNLGRNELHRLMQIHVFAVWDFMFLLTDVLLPI